MVDTDLKSEEIKELNELRKKKFDFIEEMKEFKIEKRIAIWGKIALLAKRMVTIVNPTFNIYNCKICKTAHTKSWKDGNRTVYCKAECKKLGHREISKVSSKKAREKNKKLKNELSSL